MFNILRIFNRRITGLLLTTLGVMWLSFAFVPCAMSETISEIQHQCCQNKNGDQENRKHIHDKSQCIDCGSLQPVLQSTTEYITAKTKPHTEYQPVIAEWNHNQTRPSVTIVTRLPVPYFHSLPPPLRYRVLLI